MSAICCKRLDVQCSGFTIATTSKRSVVFPAPIYMSYMQPWLKGGLTEMTDQKTTQYPGFLLGIFSGGAKSIVMQISFVMLLFSDQISGRGKSFRGGGKLPQGGAPCPPLWKKASIINCHLMSCEFQIKCKDLRKSLRTNL